MIPVASTAPTFHDPESRPHTRPIWFSNSAALNAKTNPKGVLPHFPIFGCLGTFGIRDERIVRTTDKPANISRFAGDKPEAQVFGGHTLTTSGPRFDLTGL